MTVRVHLPTRRPFRQRIAAMLLAVWFAFLAIAVPRDGTAQGLPVMDVIIETDVIRRQVESALKDSFGFQAQLAIVNALQFFGERFAYETAVWIASGGKAQSQLFDRRGWKDFLVDSALGAGLQIIDDLDKDLGIAQFICAPSAPQLRLAFKLGLQDRLKPRQPLCTWKQASSNWNAFKDQGLASTLSGIGVAFEPGESDLSAGLELHVGLGEQQAQVTLADTFTRSVNKGFRSLEDNISGLTKTPASVVSDKLTSDIVNEPKESKKRTAEGTQEALSAMDTFVPMLSAAGQALAVNFAVTLVSQTLQQQILNKGLFLGDLFKEDAEFSAPPAARQQQAQTAYAELQRPRYVSSGSYDQLSEFASCDPSRRQPTTCVIDDGFTQAIRRADSGKPMTVAEAIAAGFLHGGWPLVREGTAKDQDPNCHRGPPAGGYCASNLKKLRRARVVPIGWELAANHEANAAGRPVTLNEAIAGFHANGRNGVCGDGDAEESPFCGLIDPNWVLRYPIQECRLRAPGELLIEPNTNVRAEVCVDAPSCLETDAEGKCVGGYGYCVREENIWHLAGQSCPTHAASCRALTSREGKPIAVLTATTDRSVCTAENAGCRWYAASRDAAEHWDARDRRYFNRLVEQCPAADEGCTELVRATSDEVATGTPAAVAADAPRTFLKIAPDDLRCYDIGADGQLHTRNNHESCGAFARGCTAADVGCERFTPQDGSPAVNGQIGDGDRCPAECAGYSAYRELESAFDRRDAFDFFIPATARQCAAAEVGCSEFTNLDAIERGGESREYFSSLRRCEKPAETVSATYYTWEGSDEQGFQLRSFVLKRSQSGDTEIARNSAPQTYDGSGSCQAQYGKRVGEPGHDPEITPDCRAFYSQNGTIHYRRLSRTILVTDECVRYRVSHALDEWTCRKKGGSFSATGGCVFQGHRQESTQCSAASAGCRAYRGNAGGALRTILASDFEDGTVQGWTRGSPSAESLVVGGHSLAVERDRGAAHVLAATQNGTDAPLLTRGGSYELMLVAKGRGQVTALIQDGPEDFVDATIPRDRRTVTFSPTWQRAVIGPLALSTEKTPTAGVALTLAVYGGTVFFDSIILREVPQAASVIEGTWRTSASCDRASMEPNAAPQPQGMLGCRAYATRQNTTEYLRSFSRLCADGVVGCTAFHDTKNSAELAQQTFNNPSPDPSDLDDVTVPADSVRYLVDDRARYCAATPKGCRRFGKPTLDIAADRTGSTPIAGGWGDVFLLDQPDRYTGAGATLCTSDALFCEEYRGSDGAVRYFKDPGNRTCEFKEGVLRESGVQYRGWFKTGTDPLQACDERYLIGNTTYGVWRNADVAASGQPVKYDGWVGLCEAGHDQCTEFVDSTDRTLEHRNGKSYYALRPTVDLASCQGSVSRREGCVVLQDQSNPGTSWSAEASFALSDLQQGIRVPAVDCGRNSEQCRRCVVERACRNAQGALQGGGVTRCLGDSDCRSNEGFTCRGGEIGPTCADAGNDCTRFHAQAACQQLANNGNAVVKVQRDRACGQWLACVSATEAQDFALNRTIEVCEAIDLCESSIPDAGGSQALRCERWVRGEETEGKILTRQLYQGRTRTWSGLEYSGYALLGTYQANDLQPVNVSARRDVTDQRLVRVDPQCWGPVRDSRTPATLQACAQNPPGTCVGARDERATREVDESLQPTICGADGKGWCVNHRCISGVDGAQLSGLGTASGPRETAALPATCRAFPERDAPFPASVAEFEQVSFGGFTSAQVRTGARPGFTSANVCDPATDQRGCAGQCAYEKAKYGDATRYYAQTDRSVPQGICDGGFSANSKAKASVFACTGDPECEDERDFRADLQRALARCGGEGAQGCKESAAAQIAAQRQHGKCKLVAAHERFFGMTGICLERDRSIAMNGDPDQHPCVSWYPVQQLSGGVDLYNQYERAGFHEVAQYCAEEARYEYRASYEKKIVDQCVYPIVVPSCAALCTAGVVATGGLAALAFPQCLSGCTLAAMAAAGSAAATINTFSLQACDDPNYTPGSAFTRFAWCGRIIPSVAQWIRCAPIGGDGWRRDEEGVTSGEHEAEAYRCTNVMRVADEPTPEDTGNVAWTDRVRERVNPEEQPLPLTATRTDDAKPEHPVRYEESCGLYGQLPRNISEVRPRADERPQPLNIGEGQNGRDYLEIFTDRSTLRDAPEICEGQPLAVTYPNSVSVAASVVGARRHYEGIFRQLARLFADVRGQWSWTPRRSEELRCFGNNATANQQCTVQTANADGVRVSGDGWSSECRENGQCESVCLVTMLVPNPDRDLDPNAPPTRTVTRLAAWTQSQAEQGYIRCTQDAECVNDTDSSPLLGVPLRYPNAAPYPPDQRNQPMPDGFCSSLHQEQNGRQPGQCVNVTARGRVCTRAEDCAVNGQCRPPVQDARTAETSGTFSPINPEFQAEVFENVQSGSDRTADPFVRTPIPPRVASVKSCGGARADERCASKLDEFSVNGVDSTGSADFVDVPGGLAVLQFFGWAGRNQMPIVQVEVDWGDGAAPSGSRGKYQNHKPYCATGTDLGTSITRCSKEQELTCASNYDCPGGNAGAGTCQGAYCRLGCARDNQCSPGTTCSRDKLCVRPDGTAVHVPNACDAGTCTLRASDPGTSTCVGETSFGNFPDACTPTPFTFKHTYRCEGAGGRGWDATRGGCVFKPRVRLTDNWRWCTGGKHGDACAGNLDPASFVEFKKSILVR